MQSDDKPINGQTTNGQDNPKVLDLMSEAQRPRAKGFAWLRDAWTGSWNEGGFLHERWEEILQARQVPWHEIAIWIKTALLLTGLSIVIVALNAAANIAETTLKGLFTVPAVNAGADSGLWGTVDHPIRAFLTDQAAHLPVSPAALYAFWKLTGLLALIGGGIFRNSGARIAWLLFGAASLAMIWSATPAGGRAAATGVAAFLWALASIVALRGLTLRPVVHNHPPQYQFSPVLHLHAVLPDPASDGLFDVVPDDGIHPLQR